MQWRRRYSALVWSRRMREIGWEWGRWPTVVPPPKGSSQKKSVYRRVYTDSLYINHWQLLQWFTSSILATRRQHYLEDTVTLTTCLSACIHLAGMQNVGNGFHCGTMKWKRLHPHNFWCGGHIKTISFTGLAQQLLHFSIYVFFFSLWHHLLLFLFLYILLLFSSVGWTVM